MLPKLIYVYNIHKIVIFKVVHSNQISIMLVVLICD